MAGLRARQLLKWQPMDAVHRACVYGFLNPFKAVAVLSDYPRSTSMGFHQKSVTSNMGAITATDTNIFINPDCLLAQNTPQQGLFTCAALARSGKGLGCKSNRRIDAHGKLGNQPCQRVTTSSMLPSTLAR